MKDVVRAFLERKGVYMGWHRLGLVTGLSPASSKSYYWKLCERIREEVGGNNCPEFATENVNFGYVDALMEIGEWQMVEEYIATAILRLERSGASAIAVCSNTIHRIFESSWVASRITVPVIHIGDCVAARIAELGLKRVGFIGTKFSMEQDFILSHLRMSGAEIFVPPTSQYEQINKIIFDELCKNVVLGSSTDFLTEAIMGMIEENDIQGVVLGCTEIPLSIDGVVQEGIGLKYKMNHGTDFHFLDSEEIHIEALAEYCLEGRLPAIG